MVEPSSFLNSSTNLAHTYSSHSFAGSSLQVDLCLLRIYQEVALSMALYYPRSNLMGIVVGEVLVVVRLVVV